MHFQSFNGHRDVLMEQISTVEEEKLNLIKYLLVQKSAVEKYEGGQSNLLRCESTQALNLWKRPMKGQGLT